MNLERPLLLLFFSLLINLFSTFINTNVDAATGDVLTSFIPAPDENGRAIAFDGDEILFYTFVGDTNIYKVGTDGVSLGSIPDPGRTFTCGSLSWDSTRNVLWCGSYDGSTIVYTINPNTGVATPQFDSSAFGGIAQDSCYGPGEEAFIDGLAFDASDNTIWLSGDAGQTIYHVQTDGTPIASFTVPDHPITGTTGCNTGITVVDDHLELALQAGPDLGPHCILRVEKSNPTDSIIAAFKTYDSNIPGIEDLEFDPTTFAPTCAIWSNQFGFDVILTAWEVQCPGVELAFLSFPLQGLDPDSANISSVFDHSVEIEKGKLKFYAIDGVVVAYTGEEGRKEFGKNCDPRGYKNADMTDFNVNGSYVGAKCSTKPQQQKKEENQFPERFLNYDGHPGIDYPASLGTPIFAPADGIAFIPESDPITSQNKPFETVDKFNILAIDHNNGFSTWYLHLGNKGTGEDFRNIQCPGDPVHTIQKGERISVTKDCQIGRVGNKGTSSSHLHFEVRKGLSDFQCNPPACFPVDPYGWTALCQDDPYPGGTNVRLWE